MPRWILAILIFLSLPALAGVVGDAEDVPREFNDEPRSGIYKQSRQSTTSGSLNSAVQPDTSGPSSSTSGSSNKKSGSTALAKEKKNRTSQGKNNAPGTQNAPTSYPAVVGGGQTWPLLAIAVLLLIAAGGGGYYFYRQSDD